MNNEVIYNVMLIALLISLTLVAVYITGTISYKCSTTCASVTEIQNNFIKLKIAVNGTAAENLPIKIILGRVQQHLDTETNKTGIVSFYAPLRIGKNNIKIYNGNSEAIISLFYLGGLGAIAYLFAGAVLFLLLVRLGKSIAARKQIIIKIDKDSMNSTKVLSKKFSEWIEILNEAIKSANASKPAKNICAKRSEIIQNMHQNMDLYSTDICKYEFDYLFNIAEVKSEVFCYNEFVSTGEKPAEQIAAGIAYDAFLNKGNLSYSTDILKSNNMLLASNLSMKNILKNKQGGAIKILELGERMNCRRFLFSKNNAIALFLELLGYIEVYKC